MPNLKGTKTEHEPSQAAKTERRTGPRAQSQEAIARTNNQDPGVYKKSQQRPSYSERKAGRRTEPGNCETRSHKNRNHSKRPGAEFIERKYNAGQFADWADQDNQCPVQ